MNKAYESADIQHRLSSVSIFNRIMTAKLFIVLDFVEKIENDLYCFCKQVRIVSFGRKLQICRKALLTKTFLICTIV